MCKLYLNNRTPVKPQRHPSRLFGFLQDFVHEDRTLALEHADSHGR
jgi:hypothetical protein